MWVKTGMKQNNKYVIWLTGGSGSGKSTAAKYFVQKGFVLVDADKIAREILNKGTAAYNEVVQHFGEGILLTDKSVNRRGLGDIVFSDKESLDVLNSIMHKYITREIMQAISGEEKYLIDAPLPNKYGIECDKTVAVTAPYETRVNRIMSRDNITREQAEKRIASQISDSEYEEISDAVIKNDGDLKRLYSNIDAFLGEH